MSGQIFGPLGVLPTGGGVPVFSSQTAPGIVEDGFTHTVLTFTSGTGDGLVIVGVGYSISTTGVTGVTVNGNVCAKACGSTITGSRAAELWYVSGQTANASSSIVLTASGAFGGCAVACCSITNVTATPSGTATTPFASPADPHTVGPVTIPATGFGVAMYFLDGGSSNPPTSPSGGFSVDQNGNDGSNGFALLHSSTAGSQTCGVNITNFAGAAAAYAAWGP